MLGRKPQRIVAGIFREVAAVRVFALQPFGLSSFLDGNVCGHFRSLKLAFRHGLDVVLNRHCLPAKRVVRSV